MLMTEDSYEVIEYLTFLGLVGAAFLVAAVRHDAEVVDALLVLLEVANC